MASIFISLLLTMHSLHFHHLSYMSILVYLNSPLILLLHDLAFSLDLLFLSLSKFHLLLLHLLFSPLSFLLTQLLLPCELIILLLFLQTFLLLLHRLTLEKSFCLHHFSLLLLLAFLLLLTTFLFTHLSLPLNFLQSLLLS